MLETDHGDPGQTRNSGVEAARGAHVSFLDGDDLWGFDWLARAVAFAQTQPGPVACHSEVNVVFGSVRQTWWHADSEDPDFEPDYLMIGNYWDAMCLVDRCVLTRFPYRANDLMAGYGHEDWHWNMATLEAGIPHRPVPGTMHFKRRRKGSQSALCEERDVTTFKAALSLFESTSAAPLRHIVDPGRHDVLRLELPEVVEDWCNVQESLHAIDSICGQRSSSAGGHFSPSSVLDMRGWLFTPGANVAGRVIIALVGEQQVLFLTTERQDRTDVKKMLPDSPIYTGFSVSATLNDDWSEGAYQVALINTFGYQASFTLTKFRITVQDGMIRSFTARRLETKSPLEVFLRIAKCEPSRILDRRSKTWAATGDLQCHVDRLMQVETFENEAPFPATRNISMRGWAFQAGARLAGHNYLAFLDMQAGTCDLLPGHLEVRADVKDAMSGAPLCCGFEVTGQLPDGSQNGLRAMAIVNIAGERAAFSLLPVCLSIVGGNAVGLKPWANYIDMLTRAATLLREAPPTELPNAMETTAPEMTAAKITDAEATARRPRNRISARKGGKTVVNPIDG